MEDSPLRVGEKRPGLFPLSLLVDLGRGISTLTQVGHTRPMKSSPRLGLVALSLAILGCAGGGDCSSPYAGSPQFKGCLFANPPNPLTPPSASSWSNWTRFLYEPKVDTV